MSSSLPYTYSPYESYSNYNPGRVDTRSDLDNLVHLQASPDVVIGQSAPVQIKVLQNPESTSYAWIWWLILILFIILVILAVIFHQDVTNYFHQHIMDYFHPPSSSSQPPSSSSGSHSQPHPVSSSKPIPILPPQIPVIPSSKPIPIPPPPSSKTIPPQKSATGKKEKDNFEFFISHSGVPGWD